MLRFAERLTRSPATITAEHLAPLRAQGFADEDLLAIVEVAGYYAYANRMADGLGVLLEDEAP